jgi:hypothetical protein
MMNLKIGKMASLLALVAMPAKAEVASTVYECSLRVGSGGPSLTSASLEIYSNPIIQDPRQFPPDSAKRAGLFRLGNEKAIPIVFSNGIELKKAYLQGEGFSAVFPHGVLDFGIFYGIFNFRPGEVEISCHQAN